MQATMTKAQAISAMLAIIDNEVNGPADLTRRGYTKGKGCLIERVFPTSSGGAAYDVCEQTLGTMAQDVWGPNDDYVKGNITKAELRKTIAALAQ